MILPLIPDLARQGRGYRCYFHPEKFPIPSVAHKRPGIKNMLDEWKNIGLVIRREKIMEIDLCMTPELGLVDQNFKITIINMYISQCSIEKQK